MNNEERKIKCPKKIKCPICKNNMTYLGNSESLLKMGIWHIYICEFCIAEFTFKEGLK